MLGAQWTKINKTSSLIIKNDLTVATIFPVVLVRGQRHMGFPSLSTTYTKSWLAASLISFRNRRIHVAAFVRNQVKKVTCREYFVYRQTTLGNAINFMYTKLLKY